MDAVAAGGAGSGHRSLLRAAERTRAVARAGAGGCRTRPGALCAGRQSQPRPGDRPACRRGGLRADCLAHREPRCAHAQPAPVQHQRRRPHRRHPAPARGRAGRARGRAPQGQPRAAAGDDAAAAARLAEQGRAATACRRPHPGAGQYLAARGTGRTRRLRFPARCLVPAVGCRGLCAGARGGDRGGQAGRLRPRHRRAARRRGRAHHEGAARVRGRRGRGTPGRRADRGRQGHRPGDARFGSGPHPVDLRPAHRVRRRPGDGAGALRHRLGAAARLAHRRQENRRPARPDGGAVLHRARRRSRSRPTCLRHGRFRLARHPARPHGLVAPVGRLVGADRACRRPRIADRRLVSDVVRRRGRPDRGLGGGGGLAAAAARARRPRPPSLAGAGGRRRRAGGDAGPGAPTAPASGGCGGWQPPSRPASPPR